MINRSNINNFLYSPIHPQLINNINQFNGADANLLNHNFRTYVQDMNNYINSDEYMRACMYLSQYRDNNPIDVTIYLATPDNWVLGKRMREMLMASPKVENLTRKGYLEGCYTLDNNYDNYHNVVNGFLVKDENGDYVHKTYYSSDAFNRLNLDEQITIMDVWDNANTMINNGIDPTSFDD